MAARFSGSGQFYTRTLGLGPTVAWSLACWVRIVTDRNAISTPWAIGFNPFVSGFALQTAADGTTMSVVDTGNATAHGARALTVGTWYYWAVAVNGATGTVLSRAVGDTSATVSTWTGGDSDTNLSDLYLGNSLVTTEHFDGNLAALRLWTDVLSQAELEAEGFAYLPRRTAGLRAWYPMVRAETVDSSGAGQTLSGGSGATTEDGPPISWRQGRRRMHLPVSVPADATPGPVAADWSVPGPVISLGTSTAPGPVAADWSVPTPSVYTGPPVTPVQPASVTANWSVPAPDAAAFKNVTVTPAPVVADWSVPDPIVVVPVNPGDDLTGPGQISFGGFRMGGNRYRFRGLVGAGIDLPPVDDGNVDNPSADGAMPGRSLLRPRILEYLTNIRVPRSEIGQAALDLLNATPLPEADEEQWIAWWLDDVGIRIARGKISGRAAPVDKNWRKGLVPASVQFTCSDPRIYSRDLANATIADGSTVAVYNAGNRPTRPLLRCPGPANGPELVIERLLADGTEDMRVIGFDLEVGAGETMIIDPANNTVSIGETSKMRYLTSDSNVSVPDWTLGRGTSWITYTTSTGTAPSAVALWRHAWA